MTCDAQSLLVGVWCVIAGLTSLCLAHLGTHTALQLPQLPTMHCRSNAATEKTGGHNSAEGLRCNPRPWHRTREPTPQLTRATPPCLRCSSTPHYPAAQQPARLLVICAALALARVGLALDRVGAGAAAGTLRRRDVSVSGRKRAEGCTAAMTTASVVPAPPCSTPRTHARAPGTPLTFSRIPLPAGGTHPPGGKTCSSRR